MSTFDVERLIALLPAVFRIRDAELAGGNAQLGGPLQALLSVIAEEIGAVEENIAQLYDDQFIETCADWVVPYIGDLVGHRTLAVSASAVRFATRRAEVANAISARRRKGTAAILEQIARDVTGWPARLVENYQLLATTQYLNHLRPQVAVPDLRNMPALERIGTPFDAAPRSLEVRRVASQRGHYNIPNVSIFLWRLNTYDVEAGVPRPDAGGPDTRFYFHPAGLDAPLFNSPRPEDDPLGFVADVNLPDPLPRRALARELDQRRSALVNADDIIDHFFTTGATPFAISVTGTPPILDEHILVCDLSDWTPVPATRDYLRRSDDTMVPRVIRVGVDPVLGRFVFPAAVDPADVRVSYTYALAGDVGGGPYDRTDSLALWLDPVRRPVTWQIGVSSDADTLATANPPDSDVVASVADAVNAWKAHVTANPGAFGVITLMDSGRYDGALTGVNRIEVPAGARLAVVGAGWPRVDAAGPGGPFRPLGGLTASGVRPHINGAISVCGTAAPDEVLEDGSTRQRLPGELIFDGLLIEGEVRVLVGDLGRFEVRHSTLLPDAGDLAVNESVQPDLQNSSLVMQLDRTIAGAITLPDTVSSLRVNESIVNGAIDATGSHVDVTASTVLGMTDAQVLDASNAIFVLPVTVSRRQSGCMRYSYAPPGSATPRRFNCQPDLAVAALANPSSAAETARRVAPVFASMRYGDPAYLQLSQRCAVEIRTGADDGAEMGVFHFVQQPQREANLRQSLREHLRVGLEAGFFYRT